jgi:hypothetical protein
VVVLGVNGGFSTKKKPIQIHVLMNLPHLLIWEEEGERGEDEFTFDSIRIEPRRRAGGGSREESGRRGEERRGEELVCAVPPVTCSPAAARERRGGELLVRGNALLVLDLGLDVVDGVRRFHLEGDGLAGQCLDKDLHATTEAEDKVKGRLLLDVVVSKGPAILQLLASEDETLLVRGDALLILDLSLDIIDGVRGLHLEGDSLAGQCLHKDLHLQEIITKQIG